MLFESPNIAQNLESFTQSPYLPKARKKFLEAAEDFCRRRREHEMEMISMEEAEAKRREEEVR